VPGRPELPANVEVRYTLRVERLTSIKQECADSDEDRCLFGVKLRKEAGNSWFRFRDWARAGRAYSEGAAMADAFLSAGDSEAASGRVCGARTDCMNNLAAVFLSTREYYKARDVCIKVLEAEPNNVKALLRAARAALGAHEPKDASLCLDALQQLDPDNAALAGERARVARQLAKDREDERRVGALMFPTAHGPPAATTAPSTEPKEGEAVEAHFAVPQQQGGEGGESRSLLLVGTSIIVLVLSIVIAFYASLYSA
jgi:tetratricopeptide (TPR) repeat protein